MEKLLHYVWQHRLYPASLLYTTDGRTLQVIDPGLHNEDAGPDFFNAKVKIDGELWAGGVEIHSFSSDWVRHGHNNDEAYNNIVLHVVEYPDVEIYTLNGVCIPQLQLSIPSYVKKNYDVLLCEERYPHCYRNVAKLPPVIVNQWLNFLCLERLEQKMQRINKRAEAEGGDWEEAFFITLARSFGFGINGDAFEEWAQSFSLSAAGKHRNNQFQIEAFFLGQAGLLEENMLQPYHREKAINEGYFEKVQKEYHFLAHKFSLQPMNSLHWRFLRLRPQNFPHIRLVQLAHLYCSEQVSLSAILDADSLEVVRMLLHTSVTPYWQTHYSFGGESAYSEKSLQSASLDLIIINAVIPMLFAYGRHRQHQDYCDKAVQWLSQLKAENNRYTRIWASSGLPVKSASDSQALIQLRTVYCDRKECLRCRFGYEYLKQTRVYRPDDFLREDTE